MNISEKSMISLESNIINNNTTEICKVFNQQSLEKIPETKSKSSKKSKKRCYFCNVSLKCNERN